MTGAHRPTPPPLPPPQCLQRAPRAQWSHNVTYGCVGAGDQLMRSHSLDIVARSGQAHASPTLSLCRLPPATPNNVESDCLASAPAEGACEHTYNDRVYLLISSRRLRQTTTRSTGKAGRTLRRRSSPPHSSLLRLARRRACWQPCALRHAQTDLAASPRNTHLCNTYPTQWPNATERQGGTCIGQPPGEHELNRNNRWYDGRRIVGLTTFGSPMHQRLNME